MGYNVTHYLHDVNFHGLPQKRKRYLFIAHDMPIDFELPAPQRTGIEEVKDEVFEESPGDEIAPINDAARKAWEKMLPHLSPGQRLREYYMSLDDPDGWKPFQTVRKMRDEGPVCAALGGVRFIHPTQDRFVTVRELSRLMGYPDSYEFKGSSTDQNSYYIAKGVAVPVGEWLARNVKNHLGENPKQFQGTTVIDTRSDQFSYRFLT
jgi:DNA (cytosine-5)-methyltransferase 1